MPVFVNHNTSQGRKQVNGASYSTLDIIFDKAYSGYHVNGYTILHLGQLARILLTAETMKDFACYLALSSYGQLARR
jgi:hypothetical protein